MKISIIIVSYNHGVLLEKCIESIQKHNDIGEFLEVIIVEQYENIKKEPNFSSYGFVKYYTNKNNGFGAGNNFGYLQSDGDLLLFLNPDTELIEPIFRKVIKKINSLTDIGMIGVQLFDENKNKNLSFYFNNYNGFIAGILLKILNKFNIFIYRKMFTSGSNIFIKKEVFEKIGCFDENIFLYSEERDIVKRLLINKYRNYYLKDIKLIHKEGTKKNHFNKDSTKFRLISLNYYCNKYGIAIKKILSKEIKSINIKIFIYKYFIRKEYNFLIEEKAFIISFINKELKV